MKIMVPFSSKQRIDALSRFGSDIEIYAGFHDDDWARRFGTKDLNKMTAHGKAADLDGIEEFISLIYECHRYGIGVYLTLNATEYSSAQIEYITQCYLPRLKEASVDGIIIGDECLIDPICERNLKPVASTIMGIYNHLLVSYYKSKGIKRQIIPRDITIDEITQIVQSNPDVDFEVFLMRNGCRYSDSNCLCTHGVNGGICVRIDRSYHYYTEKKSDTFERNDWALTDHLYSSYFHRESCALCSLWRFLKLGVCSGKIVGRADDPERVLRDVELSVINLHIAEKSNCEEEYLKRMQLPNQHISFCRDGYSCYYPEIRFGGAQ